MTGEDRSGEGGRLVALNDAERGVDLGELGVARRSVSRGTYIYISD